MALRTSPPSEQTQFPQGSDIRRRTNPIPPPRAWHGKEDGIMESRESVPVSAPNKPNWRGEAGAERTQFVLQLTAPNESSCPASTPDRMKMSASTPPLNRGLSEQSISVAGRRSWRRGTGTDEYMGASPRFPRPNEPNWSKSCARAEQSQFGRLTFRETNPISRRRLRAERSQIGCDGRRLVEKGGQAPIGVPRSQSPFPRRTNPIGEVRPAPNEPNSFYNSPRRTNRHVLQAHPTR